MSTRTISLARLPAALAAEQKAIKKKVETAIRVTGRKAERIIKSKVPVAFGELSESVVTYSDGGQGCPATVISAPHAQAVEIGSPPHKPDFEKLVEWVKLRNIQGMTKKGRGKTGNWGALKRQPTSVRQARRISKMFRKLIVRAQWGHNRTGAQYKGKNGRYLPIDAPTQVARAISRGIEQHGTKPHWYARNSIPEIEAVLAAEIASRLSGSASASGGDAPQLGEPSPIGSGVDAMADTVLA